MRTLKSLTLIALTAVMLGGCGTERSDARWTMWYDQPAKDFVESLVLGNGTMGAIVYGGVEKDSINLNDITLWSGEPVNPDLDTLAAKEGLAAVRQALEAEDYRLADQLQRRLQGKFSQCYQPMGGLTIQTDGEGQVQDYRRSLDISRAVAKVSYRQDGTQYEREYFVSAPDKVMAVRLKSGGKGKISGVVAWNSPLRHRVTAAGNMMTIEGYAPYHISWEKEVSWDENRGIHFATLVKVAKADGTVTCGEDGTIRMDGCSDVVLLVTTATSYNGFDKDPVREGRDYRALAAAQMEAAAGKSYRELAKRHTADFASFFDRVDIQLGAPGAVPDTPTDKRLLAMTEGADDPNLEMLYFQFGRYLMISASRTPGVPMNLQGLWNEQMLPPWNSNYTVNINTEENYWPAEVLNLSELHQPLLQFIGNIAQTGRHSARNYYGCDGWVTCHNSDIWAMSNPVGELSGDPRWANWPMGGAWLSTHLMEHYLFNPDRDWLANYAYPLMKGAAEFCLSWLVEDRDGYLITSPSTSPENEYTTPDGYHGQTLYGGAADLAIVRECLGNVMEAARILETDSVFRQRVEQAYSRLRPYQVGRKGNLQEWYYDWEDPEPQHRHQSHLIGLYPGHHIHPESTPALARASARSLELRGDKATGWSTGWRVNLWARLHDGNHAYNIYRMLLNYVNPSHPVYQTGGGTYPNLLDSHPPFQIDGNFGGTSGVTEMLIQSGQGSIDLLPALPDAWSEGSFKGFCARGGFEVSLEWADGGIKRGSILSKAGTRCTVRSRTPIRVRHTGNVTTTTDGVWHVAAFDTQAGKTYQIEPAS